MRDLTFIVVGKGEDLNLFWASGIKWYVGDSLHLGRSVTPEQARQVKTVKVLLRIAKSSQDQTVGSILNIRDWIAIDWVTCRSVFNIYGLNVQSGHCNPHYHRGEQC